MSLEDTPKQSKKDFDWKSLSAENYDLNNVPWDMRESKFFQPEFLPSRIGDYWKTYVAVLGHDDESWFVANQKLENTIGDGLLNIFKTVAEFLNNEEYDKACGILNRAGKQLIIAYRESGSFDEEDLERIGILGYIKTRDGEKHSFTKLSG